MWLIVSIIFSFLACLADWSETHPDVYKHHWHLKGVIRTNNFNRTQDWIHNEMKTDDPAYDGKYHPEHYHGKGSSVRAVLIIGGALSMLGGGAGIYIGLLMIVIGILSGRK